MLTNKPMWMRFAVPIGVFALVLLVEDGLINLFPTVTMLYDALLLTGLGGAFIMSLFLPHPRQERKLREKLRAMENTLQTMPVQAQEYWNSPEGSARLKAHDEETLAEKRP